MEFSNKNTPVGILGAGIMGCCLALELAQQGLKIDLFDLSPTPMNGASLHNEGKLHLGFVYAKDPNGTTHKVMLRGSLAFADILEKLTGCSPSDLNPSYPFHYFVPNDSMLDLDEIQEHFQCVEGDINEEVKHTGRLYLGRKIDRFYQLNTKKKHSEIFSQEHSMGSLRTEELSVSPAAVAGIIRKAVINHPKIRFFGCTEILSAELHSSSDIRIEMLHSKKISARTYPCVANCLWDGKLKIDRSIGFPSPGPWIFRYKATINLSVPSTANIIIPSATGILGSYGDVVNHGSGSYYISWYPLCKMAQSINQDGRLLHNEVHKHRFPEFIRQAIKRYPSFSQFIASTVHRKFVKDNISALSVYIPSLRHFPEMIRSFEIGGGIILARGSSDIDDPDSYLHQRAAIGPVVFKNYLSIDTGKYCTAPLFAVEAAGMIGEILS